MPSSVCSLLGREFGGPGGTSAAADRSIAEPLTVTTIAPDDETKARRVGKSHEVERAETYDSRRAHSHAPRRQLE